MQHKPTVARYAARRDARTHEHRQQLQRRNPRLGQFQIVRNSAPDSRAAARIGQCGDAHRAASMTCPRTGAIAGAASKRTEISEATSATPMISEPTATWAVITTDCVNVPAELVQPAIHDCGTGSQSGQPYFSRHVAIPNATWHSTNSSRAAAGS